jgi:L-rhamnose mutarotase
VSRRYCMTLDLKTDPALIAEYKRQHEKIWPEVEASIRETGVTGMEIYLRGARMFMIMEVRDDFSLEAKERADRENAKVREWEELMSRYQQALPGSKPGEKWLLMEKIFDLNG